jgi:hypothetical protein
MPAVLLEAGSIINRDEELAMASPERQSIIADAVADAVALYCAARSRRLPDRLRPIMASGGKAPIRRASSAVSSAASSAAQANSHR